MTTSSWSAFYSWASASDSSSTVRCQTAPDGSPRCFWGWVSISPDVCWRFSHRTCPRCWLGACSRGSVSPGHAPSRSPSCGTSSRAERWLGVTSIIMAIFVLVPIVAPALGQAVLNVASWRAIFGIYMTQALIVGAWSWTAPRGDVVRGPAHAAHAGARERSRSRSGENPVGPGLHQRRWVCVRGVAWVSEFGAANSAATIRSGYPLSAVLWRPGRFSGWRIVPQRCTRRAVPGCDYCRSGRSGLSGPCPSSVLGIACLLGGHPPLWALMSYLMLSFFGIGLTFGNLNALAMQPLGHIAGTGAAVVGALATLLSIVFGTVIGQGYNGTVLPLVAGFAIISALALVAMRWAARENQR